MHRLLSDLRQACTALGRSPGFTLAAIFTLALGMGGTIAIFSALHAAVLRTPPYPQAERLYRVRMVVGERPTVNVSAIPMREMAAATPAVEAFGVYTRFWRKCEMETESGRETIPAAWVDAGIFHILQPGLALGTHFSAEHYASGEGVILTHRFWRERMGADPGIVGRSLALSGQTQPVVGVLKADFELPFATGVRLLRPLPALRPTQRGEFRFTALARLREGAAPGAVGAVFRRVAEEQAKAYPLNTIEGAMPVLIPLHRAMGSTAGSGFLLVCGAAALLLLLATTNVAALFLNRSATRVGETAVRISLGATPLQLLRSSLPESLLVTGISTALGFVMAVQMGDLLRLWLPGGRELHGLGRAWAQPGVAVFALVLVLLLGLVLGCIPLLQARRMNVEATLRAAGPKVCSKTRVRDGLVVLQLAMATLLLFGVCLLSRSLWQLAHQSLGFREAGLVTVDLEQKQQQPELPGLDTTQLIRSLASRPGIQQAVTCGRVPMAWDVEERYLGGAKMQNSDGSIINASREASTLRDSEESVGLDFVSAGYVEALGLPLLQGRTLTTDDIQTRRRVCLLDQKAAARFFPDGALGRPFHVGMETSYGSTPLLQMGEPLEVIGVVGSFRAQSPEEPPTPLALAPSSLRPSLRLLLRTALPEKAIQAEVAAALGTHLPALRVRKLQTLEALRWEQALPRRQVLALVLPFGALALLLAALGLGTLMGSQVAQRTRELGLRAALGAAPRALLAFILQRALLRSALGVLLGLGASLALARTLKSLLYGIPALDVASLTGAVVVLLATSVLATLLPALRAARIQPAEALRSE